jgi:transcriptional regulator with XRE-family HTH domain
MKSGMKYKFGKKLRAVRERKGYTLKDVAKRASVSESLISQIERNRVSPSIDTLLLIADVLDIDYEYLFSDYRQKRGVSIVRASERDSIRQNQVVIHQLSVTDQVSKTSAIEAFLLEIEAAGETGDQEYGHTGTELGLILEGSGELTYGNETYDLDAGDSISFASDIPHLFKNTGNSVLKAIWVVTPPRKLFRS